MFFRVNSLKKCVEDLYSKNTDYKYPEQAINQAESLKALSSDLYTDNIRFIYELIQNADDSGAKSLTLTILNDGQLIVGHDGKPFDEKDVQGLCGVNNGTKKRDISKTGYKGLGFKAVFGKSSCVTVYSNGEYFRFDSSHPLSWNQSWGTPDQKTWESSNDRLFQYPWQINPLWTDENQIPQIVRNFLQPRKQHIRVAYIIVLDRAGDIRSALDQLKQLPYMFLFLRNITRIDFVNSVVAVQRHVDDGSVSIVCDQQNHSQWIMKSFELEVPDHVRTALAQDSKVPEKLRGAQKAEISFAARCQRINNEYKIEKLEDGQGHLFCYLPTKIADYKFPMLVNSNFLTNANREQIHADSPWNQWLFAEIGTKIFEWIKGIVINPKFGIQAYNLIPSDLNLIDNDLSNAFNQAYKQSMKQCNFILNRKGELLKVDQVVMDSTSLSTQLTFINLNTMRQFMIEHNRYSDFDCAEDPFIDPNLNLRNIGVRSFNWQLCIQMFQSDIFLETHSVEDNKRLIEYFYSRCSNERIRDYEFKKKIEQIPFIMDQNGELIETEFIYFPLPTLGDGPTTESDCAYIHKDVFSWLQEYPQQKIKEWLVSHGVLERTDLTFLDKTIIPNAAKYITKDNAVETIRMLFKLFQNQTIEKEKLEQCRQLKLLTTKGTLLAAEECFFSDKYRPQLALEEYLKDLEDKFVSESYPYINSSVSETNDFEEWRRFFLAMGVRDKLHLIHYQSRTETSQLIKDGFLEQFLIRPSPNGRRPADAYSGLKTILFLNRTIGNYRFAQVFWSYVLNNMELNDFHQYSTRVFWRSSYGTEISDVQYIQWFVRNTNCIPTTLKDCQPSTSIFVKTKEVERLCGSYLPVIDIPDLKTEFSWSTLFPASWPCFFHSSWLTVFGFKQSLSMQDYFTLLDRIYRDEKNLEDNQDRLQAIYRSILDTCPSWSSDDHQRLKTRSKWLYLLAETNQWKLTENLYFFTDIDSCGSGWTDVFPCLKLNRENRTHSEIKRFLQLFNIKQINGSDLTLKNHESSIAKTLRKRLLTVAPYLKNWLKKNAVDQNTILSIDQLLKETVTFYESKSLELFYNDTFLLETDVFYNSNEQGFYVTRPWDSETTLMSLPRKLCQLLNIGGNEDHLRFLLKASAVEIEAYYRKSRIEIPTPVDLATISTQQQTSGRSTSLTNEPIIGSERHPENGAQSTVQRRPTDIVRIESSCIKRSRSKSAHRSSSRTKKKNQPCTSNDPGNRLSDSINLIDLSRLSLDGPIVTNDFLTDDMEIDNENDEVNRQTGITGEELVYNYLSHKYRDRSNTVSINWINKNGETYQPYDIILTENGKTHYIEVKSTRFSNQHSFFISMQQIKAIIERKDQYHIYRVYLPENKIVIIDNILTRLENKDDLALRMIIDKNASHRNDSDDDG